MIFNRLPSLIKRGLIIFFALLALQLAALTVGTLYQSLASAEDRRTFPAPGRLVDVGGFRMHIYCTGPHVAGRPTVIFEGGLGTPSFMWAKVQPEMAALTRTCTYDRAGYGWSDPSPQPRTARQMADELHILLEKSAEAPPYLLLGHSFGAVIARSYATRYPQQVSGLILSDPRHEDFFARLPASYRQIDQENLQNAQTLKIITPFGITRFLGVAGLLDRFEYYLAPLPVHARETAWALMVYNPQHWVTAVDERLASPESYDQVRNTTLPANMPLIVLSAENGADAWKSPSFVVTDEDRSIWMTLQQEQAQLSSNSQWIIVPGSGHYIHLDKPSALVDAVRMMLGK